MGRHLQPRKSCSHRPYWERSGLLEWLLIMMGVFKQSASFFCQFRLRCPPYPFIIDPTNAAELYIILSGGSLRLAFPNSWSKRDMVHDSALSLSLSLFLSLSLYKPQVFLLLSLVYQNRDPHICPVRNVDLKARDPDPQMVNFKNPPQHLN